MGEFGDLIIAIHVGVIQGRAQCGSWFVNYAAATLPEARPGVLGTIALRYGNDLIDSREEICYDRRNTKLSVPTPITTFANSSSEYAQSRG